MRYAPDMSGVSRGRLELLAGLAFSGFLATACGERPPGRVETLASAPAVALAESLELDIGTKTAREAMVFGWLGDEESGGRTFAWAVGDESVLELSVFDAAGQRVLKARGRPPVQLATQEVTPYLNGTSLGSAVLDPGGAELSFAVPEGLLAVGLNELRLLYAHSTSADDDARALAVAWDSIRLEADDEAQSGTGLGFSRPPSGRFTLAVENQKALRPWQRPTAVLHEDGRGPVDLSLRPGTNELPAETEGPFLLQLDARPGQAFEVRYDEGPAPNDLARSRLETPKCAATTPTHVVLYVIDTLRADRVGTYGYDRGTTPHIDAFAEGGIVWNHAVAQSPWTRPSVASILTGLSPLTHGVNGRRSRLEDESLTLAEILQEAGYETAGFVTNPNVAGRYGFRQGFDTYAQLNQTTAEQVNTRARHWLAARDAGRPFFLYLHTVEPHAPYQASDEYLSRFASGVRNPRGYRRPFMNSLSRLGADEASAATAALLQLYDAEIALNDEKFGDLLELLAAQGVLENTVVLLVSDHGEEFFEHGRWEHGKSLYTEVLDIPMLGRFPGCPPARSDQLAQHVDLVPTLLDYLGIETDQQFDGRALALAGDDAASHGVITSYLRVDGFHGIAATTTEQRYISPLSTNLGSAQLFDRKADPRELENQRLQKPISSLYFSQLLRRTLATWIANTSDVQDDELDEKTLRQLRALGYIQ